MEINCVICQEKIKEEDNYFKVDLFIEGKLKGTDHAHQNCWIKKNQRDSDAKELVNGGLRLLRSVGLNKEEGMVVHI